MTTGQRIKSLRVEKGLSQAELGSLIGVKKAAINKYESGAVVNIKRATIEKLAEALDTTPVYLLGWDPRSILEITAEDSGLQAAVNLLKRASMDEDIKLLSPDEIERMKKHSFVPSKKSRESSLTSEELGRISAAMSQMNEEGREKVVDYAEDLAAGGRYKKTDTDTVGKEA